MVNVKKTTIAIVLTLLMAASILMVSNNATFIGTAKAYQPKAGEFGAVILQHHWRLLCSTLRRHSSMDLDFHLLTLAFHQAQSVWDNNYLLTCRLHHLQAQTDARVGYSVTFTKPDGTTDTVSNLNSYVADGTSWFNYSRPSR